MSLFSLGNFLRYCPKFKITHLESSNIWKKNRSPTFSFFNIFFIRDLPANRCKRTIRRTQTKICIQYLSDRHTVIRSRSFFLRRDQKPNCPKTRALALITKYDLPFYGIPPIIFLHLSNRGLRSPRSRTSSKINSFARN